MPQTILKTLVGSHAHGLATPSSDYDYRSVYVVPTSHLLMLNGRVKFNNWQEKVNGENVDDTSYEIGHFLHLATKSNPTILEVLRCQSVRLPEYGNDPLKKTLISSFAAQLIDLFPVVWSTQAVHDAFIGYSMNQRKKGLDKNEKRKDKFFAAYLRTLIQGLDMLQTGDFNPRVIEYDLGPMVREIKEGRYDIGEVINVCLRLERDMDDALAKHKTDGTMRYPKMDRINKFLFAVRSQFFYECDRCGAVDNSFNALGIELIASDWYCRNCRYRDKITFDMASS